MMPISYNPRNRFMPDRSTEPPDVYEKCPECPCCHEECEKLILDDGNNVIGCENCLSIVDADEYLAEQEEMARAWAEEMRHQDAWERSHEDG